MKLNKILKNPRIVLVGVILLLTMILIYLNMDDIEDFIVGKIFKTNIQLEGNLYSSKEIIGKKKIMTKKACFNGKCLDYWDFVNFKALPIQDDVDLTLVNTKITEPETKYLRELESKGINFFKRFLVIQKQKFLRIVNRSKNLANSIYTINMPLERFTNYDNESIENLDSTIENFKPSKKSTFYGEVVVKGNVNANVNNKQFVDAKDKIIAKEFCLGDFDNCLNKTDVRTYKKYSDRILNQLCIGNYCIEEKHLIFLKELYKLNIKSYYDDLRNKYRRLINVIHREHDIEKYKRRGAPNKEPYGHCKPEQCTVPWRGRRCKGIHEDYTNTSDDLTYYKGNIESKNKVILEKNAESNLIKTNNKICTDNDADQLSCLSVNDVPIFDNIARRTPNQKQICIKKTCVEEKHFYYLKVMYKLQIINAFNRLEQEYYRKYQKLDERARYELNWHRKYCRREQCRPGRVCKG